jgi:RNA polymerase sigma factor (sigma-70 family)
LDESPQDPTSSFELLKQARAGNGQALETLLARYLPRLRRWASGRLPHGARDLVDTEDIVQETLIRALRHIDTFEYRREGALQAYLRQAVHNRITDQARRIARRPRGDELTSGVADLGPSPLEQSIGNEALERYERALQRLTQDDREAVILRVELGCQYSEVAQALQKPSVGAARMAIIRAIARLGREMTHGQ